ncbi:hypothetical protein TBLA_0B05070 [Henningerozyma blattae CBS 6284]|uniref:AP-3 complex subunit delta n=1 Tax=Henningerozyma blattae (strain ATCC 34711 / CBS 6284 / DSM 70876 / NBRC 10599 / NRRL Y-10934 / UCD 77-7) TaxID=1071380 RepID=I2GYY9_HENB6|nr:hypothetical protein TBLA_0B05070 [Tetrapisispora blattae CBS 6284]CCH59341.1 hypothetical protein TBLA_0B05070 [Tetrapisispora blattae CBS 6284]
MSSIIETRLSPFGLYFEKSLKGLIKEIRNNNNSREQLMEFLNNELITYQKEINNITSTNTINNLIVKSNIILKLTYLEMYGFDMSWANFYILEIMSSKNFQQKRIGYLAASQTFYKDDDISILATNLIKNDLKYTFSNNINNTNNTNSVSTYKIGIALNGISNICTSSLARDISDDLVLMLKNKNPYIRKKTIIALFKVFLNYPESLRDNFDAFIDCLNDSDLSVISTTISVIVELSKKIPNFFIKISPILYDLLINIDNNWIIIRLLKLFTNLTNFEPKLKFKLLPKVLNLLNNSNATSIIYESINCILNTSMLDANDFSTAQICLNKLLEFLNSKDPNLRFISCSLFIKIGKININFILNYSNEVLNFLNDIDISIRLKSLNLLVGITNDDNLIDTVNILKNQLIVNEEKIVVNSNKEIKILIPMDYKIKIIKTIINLVSINNYSNVPDFNWLIDLLYDLVFITKDSLTTDQKELGILLGHQFKTLMIKVPDIRTDILVNLIKLINFKDIEKIPISSILPDIIWSIGEFSTLIDNCNDLITDLLNLNLKDTKPINYMIITLLKLFNNYCNPTSDSSIPTTENILIYLNSILEYLSPLSYSKNFEIQERTNETMEFLKISKEAIEATNEIPILISEVLPGFFNSYDLVPVSLDIQRNIFNNELNIDLDTPFLSSEEMGAIINESLLNTDTSDNQVSLLKSLDYDWDSDADSHSDFEIQSNKSLNAEDHVTENLLDVKDSNNHAEKVVKQKSDNPFILDSKLQTRSVQSTNSLFSSDNKPQSNNHQIKINNSLNSVVDENPSEPKLHKKITVLTEATLPNFSSSTGILTTEISSLSLNPASTKDLTKKKKKKNQINLNLPNKLESFDFKNNQITNAIQDADLMELEELRQKFKSQANAERNAQENINSDNDEVIIIKKKKKKTKKKDTDGKEKKKKKKKAKPAVDTGPKLLTQNPPNII